MDIFFQIENYLAVNRHLLQRSIIDDIKEKGNIDNDYDAIILLALIAANNKPVITELKDLKTAVSSYTHVEDSEFTRNIADYKTQKSTLEEQLDKLVTGKLNFAIRSNPSDNTTKTQIPNWFDDLKHFANNTVSDTFTIDRAYIFNLIELDLNNENGLDEASRDYLSKNFTEIIYNNLFDKCKKSSYAYISRLNINPGSLFDEKTLFPDENAREIYKNKIVHELRLKGFEHNFAKKIAELYIEDEAQKQLKLPLASRPYLRNRIYNAIRKHLQTPNAVLNSDFKETLLLLDNTQQDFISHTINEHLPDCILNKARNLILANPNETKENITQQLKQSFSENNDIVDHEFTQEYYDAFVSMAKQLSESELEVDSSLEKHLPDFILKKCADIAAANSGITKDQLIAQLEEIFPENLDLINTTVKKYLTQLEANNEALSKQVYNAIQTHLNTSTNVIDTNFKATLHALEAQQVLYIDKVTQAYLPHFISKKREAILKANPQETPDNILETLKTTFPREDTLIEKVLKSPRTPFIKKSIIETPEQKFIRPILSKNYTAGNEKSTDKKNAAKEALASELEFLSFNTEMAQKISDEYNQSLSQDLIKTNKRILNAEVILETIYATYENKHTEFDKTHMWKCLDFLRSSANHPIISEHLKSINRILANIKLYANALANKDNIDWDNDPTIVKINTCIEQSSQRINKALEEFNTLDIDSSLQTKAQSLIIKQKIIPDSSVLKFFLSTFSNAQSIDESHASFLDVANAKLSGIDLKIYMAFSNHLASLSADTTKPSIKSLIKQFNTGELYFKEIIKYYRKLDKTKDNCKNFIGQVDATITDAVKIALMEQYYPDNATTFHQTDEQAMLKIKKAIREAQVYLTAQNLNETNPNYYNANAAKIRLKEIKALEEAALKRQKENKKLSKEDQIILDNRTTRIANKKAIKQKYYAAAKVINDATIDENNKTKIEAISTLKKEIIAKEIQQADAANLGTLNELTKTKQNNISYWAWWLMRAWAIAIAGQSTYMLVLTVMEMAGAMELLTKSVAIAGIAGLTAPMWVALIITIGCVVPAWGLMNYLIDRTSLSVKDKANLKISIFLIATTIFLAVGFTVANLFFLVPTALTMATLGAGYLVNRFLNEGSLERGWIYLFATQDKNGLTKKWQGFIDDNKFTPKELSAFKFSFTLNSFLALLYAGLAGNVVLTATGALLMFSNPLTAIAGVALVVAAILVAAVVFLGYLTLTGNPLAGLVKFLSNTRQAVKEVKSWSEFGQRMWHNTKQFISKIFTEENKYRLNTTDSGLTYAAKVTAKYLFTGLAAFTFFIPFIAGSLLGMTMLLGKNVIATLGIFNVSAPTGTEFAIAAPAIATKGALVYTSAKNTATKITNKVSKSLADAPVDRTVIEETASKGSAIEDVIFLVSAGVLNPAQNFVLNSWSVTEQEMTIINGNGDPIPVNITSAVGATTQSAALGTGTGLDAYRNYTAKQVKEQEAAITSSKKMVNA